MVFDKAEAKEESEIDLHVYEGEFSSGLPDGYGTSHSLSCIDLIYEG